MFDKRSTCKKQREGRPPCEIHVRTLFEAAGVRCLPRCTLSKNTTGLVFSLYVYLGQGGQRRGETLQAPPQHGLGVPQGRSRQQPAQLLRHLIDLLISTRAENPEARRTGKGRDTKNGNGKRGHTPKKSNDEKRTGDTCRKRGSLAKSARNKTP